MRRKYSVVEINRMRTAISGATPCTGKSYTERLLEIEEKLRTHMLNGTDPSELITQPDRLLREDDAA